MTRRAAIVFLVLACNPAYADMVEVKGKGVLNGKVVSQDARELHFLDARGQMQVFPAADVQFVDIQADRPARKEKPALFKGLGDKMARTWRRFAKQMGRWKRSTEKATQGAMSGLSQPLDRSRADAKAESLSKAMDEASRAAAGMNKKVLNANTYNKRVGELSSGDLLRHDRILDADRAGHVAYSQESMADKLSRNKVLDTEGNVYKDSKGKFGSLDG